MNRFHLNNCHVISLIGKETGDYETVSYILPEFHIHLQLLHTHLSLKSSIIWDIMPCSLYKVNRHFGGTCRLHLLGLISQARNQGEACSKLCVITQKIDLFITTAVRSSENVLMEATCSSKMSIDFQWTLYPRRQKSSDSPLWEPQIIHHCPLRYVIALTRQDIIISLVFKFGASSPTGTWLVTEQAILTDLQLLHN
jgi:hypothetical protein